MRVRLRGGPFDGRIIDVAEGYLSVRMPYLENPDDQKARTHDDYVDPTHWEPHPIETWRLVRKDRPRFGQVTYAYTGEQDTSGLPIFG